MGRSAVACMRKSKKMFLALPQDRNFWTDEETQQLLDLLLTHGENWKVIGQIIGRTWAACKHKAVKSNFIMKQESKRPDFQWSEEEKQKLVTAIKNYGQDWAYISKIVGKRSYTCNNQAIKLGILSKTSEKTE